MIERLPNKLMSLIDIRKIIPLQIREVNENHVKLIKQFRKITEYTDDIKIAFIKEIKDYRLFGGNHLLDSMKEELDNKMLHIQVWKVDTIEECKNLAIGDNINLPSTRYELANNILSYVEKYGIGEAVKRFDFSESVVNDYCLISKVPKEYAHLLIENINTSRATYEHPLTNGHVKICNEHFGLNSPEAIESYQFLENIGEKTRMVLSVDKYKCLCEDKLQEPEKTFDTLLEEYNKRERLEKRVIIDELSKEHYEAYEPILLNDLNPKIEEYQWVMDLGASTLYHDCDGDKVPSTSLTLINLFKGKIILFGKEITPKLRDYVKQKDNVNIPLKAKVTDNWSTFIPQHLSFNKEKGLVLWDQLGWSISPNLIDALLFKRPNTEIILTILDPFREEQHIAYHKPSSLTELFGSKFYSMRNFDDYLNEFSKLLKEKSISFRIVFRNERLILAILKHINYKEEN